MSKIKLVRITTVPISLEKLLEGQLSFMSQFYEVTAISSEPERLHEYGTKENVNTYAINLTREITPINDLRAVYQLFRYFQREKPTIVHSHTPKAGIVGMMAAYLARVPIRMHTVAGLPLMEATGMKRILLNFVEKLTYRCATHVYPNSKGLKAFIQSEKFTAPKKLKIIGEGSSNGIDVDHFSPDHFSEDFKNQKRTELKIPRNDFVFIFVGRLVKDKGINELIEAFVNVNNRHRNSTLLLVGPYEHELDPLLPKTLSLIESHQKIVHVGFQKDVRPFMAVSDALAFPSYREGFPNVVMQAGAMELALIVSDINGCNEIVTAHKNGLIVPPKDRISLEGSMNKLVENADLRKSLIAASRAEITSRYDRKNMWKLLRQEYDALIDNM